MRAKCIFSSLYFQHPSGALYPDLVLSSDRRAKAVAREDAKEPVMQAKL